MTDAEHYELQEFYDHAYESFVVDMLPQSREGAKASCQYSFPAITNHGCAIGCRDGFDDLPQGRITTLDVWFCVASRLRLSGKEVNVTHDSLCLALRELQDLHDEGRISKGPRRKRREYMVWFADKWGLEEVTG